MSKAKSESPIGNKAQSFGALLALLVGTAAAIGCSSNGSSGPGSSDGGGATSGPSGNGGSTHQGGSASGGSDGTGGGTSGTGGSGGQIKWNPGHYMASGGIVRAGGMPDTGEMGHMKDFPAIVGYRLFITWGALEPTKDQYDFDAVDATLEHLENDYDTPRQLVLVVLPGAFTSTKPGTNDGSMIPLYLQESSEYGPSPVSGRYGWWGGTGNGNTYAATLHRPKVMERWTLLHEALGKKYDADPRFEAIMFQEDSWEIGASSTNGCKDYDDDAMIDGYTKVLLPRTLAAFPHTNVIFENTWCGKSTATQELEQFMFDNRVAPGTADTFGQTYVDEHDGHLNSWGLEAYQGVSADQSAWHGADMRPKARAMLDVEGPDVSAYGFHGYTVPDILTAANQSYKASHLFWTYLEANSHPDESALWENLAPYVSTNPLTNIGYPENYP